jgi:hypothetical protein
MGGSCYALMYGHKSFQRSFVMDNQGCGFIIHRDLWFDRGSCF